MEKIVECIKKILSLGKPTRESIIEVVGNYEFDRDTKCLIWYYFFPRQLMDRELPKRIQENRVTRYKPLGWIEPEISEIALLLEASQTEQYKRFMMHLFHSFTKDPGLIYNPNGTGFEECCISGRILLDYNSWTENCDKYDTTGKEFIEKQYLAFGSSESKVIVSLSCLIQLKYTYDILKGIDPKYLEWERA